MKRILPALAGAAVLAACSLGSSHPDGPTVLRSSAKAMASVHSLAADLKFGPGVVVQGLTLSSASTRISLPSDSDTTFKVRQGDFLVDVRLLTTGGRAYLQLPFSKFTALSPEQSAELPSLALMFDSQHGLPSVLPRARNAQWVAAEKVGGVDCDRVSAVYSTSDAASLAPAAPAASGAASAASGAAISGDVKAVLWAGVSDHLLRRAVLTGPLMGPGQDVTVDVTLHDFNAPVTITPPTP